VALLLSLKPETNVAQIEYIIRQTADDIYEKGWDFETAWGVVNTLAAAHFIAPDRFGVPPPKPTPPARRRSVGPR
jgi:hypothetical protein